MSCNGTGSCNHSPCPHEKEFRLFCVDEYGQKTLVHEEFYASFAVAQEEMINEYWDERLRGASCYPVIEAVEDGVDHVAK